MLLKSFLPNHKELCPLFDCVAFIFNLFYSGLQDVWESPKFNEKETWFKDFEDGG